MTQSADGTYRRSSWRYENRFRYMLRTNIPLPFEDQKYYVGVYDEIFFNFGKNVAANVFDQNRAYIALGRNMGHQTRLEVGFMEQTLQQRSGRVFEHNHTLMVSMYSKLPFGHYWLSERASLSARLFSESASVSLKPEGRPVSIRVVAGNAVLVEERFNFALEKAAAPIRSDIVS